MKTITLKVDDGFEALLSRLAARLGMSRSEVIREAVLSYEPRLDRDVLRSKVSDASRRTRAQSADVSSDPGAGRGDGL